LHKSLDFVVGSDFGTRSPLVSVPKALAFRSYAIGTRIFTIALDLQTILVLEGQATPPALEKCGFQTEHVL
jgi:hypothetical protein